MNITIHSYPKVYSLGHGAIAELFDDTVTVSEKVDGSQFSFKKQNGQLVLRSKKVHFTAAEAPDLFRPAVETVMKREDILYEGWTYRAEVLKAQRHNVLTYNRVPSGHIIIFDIDVGIEDYLPYAEVQKECERLGLECVPVFYVGRISSKEMFKELLKRESCLGGTVVEGVVIKNYNRYGEDGKVLMGKYVREDYKEVHKKEWKKTDQKGIIEKIATMLRTSQRWQKAVFHLRDEGKLQCAPQDIGPLMAEVKKDIEEECADLIKEELFKWAWPEIRRKVVYGFAEWYKEWLMEKQFEGKEK